jgi:hypothetical protein
VGVVFADNAKRFRQSFNFLTVNRAKKRRQAYCIILRYTAIAVRYDNISLKEGFLQEFSDFLNLWTRKPVNLTVCHFSFKERVG